MLDEILTIQEIADYLKLSRTTVWRWCNEGKLHAFKVGRSWRVDRGEVERLMGRPVPVREHMWSTNVSGPPDR
jgi:excisionase family DNA binding protein